MIFFVFDNYKNNEQNSCFRKEWVVGSLKLFTIKVSVMIFYTFFIIILVLIFCVGIVESKLYDELKKNIIWTF